MQHATSDEIPSFSTNSWPKRNFGDISANLRGMFCSERLEISSENSFYAANIRGDNSLQLFILSKRFCWICGSVLLYVKLPWNFPLRFESSAWPMLFATMATLSVSIVSMRLGSFTYSTFGSHRGQRVISPTSRSPTSLVASPTRWVALPTSYCSLRQRQISSNNLVIT